jgi:hypothetical protein
VGGEDGGGAEGEGYRNVFHAFSTAAHAFRLMMPSFNCSA